MKHRLLNTNFLLLESDPTPDQEPDSTQNGFTKRNVIKSDGYVIKNKSPNKISVIKEEQATKLGMGV